MNSPTKVLLITPQDDLDVIGLRYLHSTLLAKGFDSSLLFLAHFKPDDGRSLANLAAFARGLDPQLVGISLMSHEFQVSTRITSTLREALPGVPIVWGGIHPTISPDTCLEHADFACRGEGENTLVEMAGAVADSSDLTGIRNLCYLRNGDVVENELHPLISDLDELPAPENIPSSAYIYEKGEIVGLDRESFRRHSRYSGTTYSVISSRGCPFSCTYCCNNYVNRMYGSRKIRRRSAENVLAELEQVVAEYPEIEYINFQDDCFIAVSREYLREFCDGYKRRVKRPFIIRSIPTYIKRDKMEMLKDAGLSWINLGLQSGSDRVCRELYQRQSLREDFLKAAHVVKDLKISAFYDVILDNPFETEEEKLRTVETLIETPKPFYPEIFSLSLYYGTELYKKALEECPEEIEDSMEKNYLVYRKSPINKLIRTSVFLNPAMTRGLVKLYRKNPDNTMTRTALVAAGVASSVIFEPLAYFRLIKLSQGGSLVKTAKVMPNYFRKGLERYLDQFRD